jgi:GNAT superfamily N-acetyltransferase
MSSQDRPWTPAALAAADERNLAEAWASFGQVPDVAVDATPAMVRVATGLPNPALNGVVRARLAPDEVDARIDDTLAWFTTQRVPMIWWVGPTSSPDDLGARLEVHGLSRVGTTPGMSIHLDALPDVAPVPDDCTIAHVTDEASLRVVAQVAALGFEFATELLPPLTRFLVGLGGETSAWQFYVARLGAAAVATASLLLGSEVAGIYTVATLPEARRKGIGAAVTLAALQDARELGYPVAILQASEMGHPVYRRLGFQDHGVYTLYHWAPPAA